MPQYVEAFGQTVEFPDGMSQADIASALKKNALSVPAAAATAPAPAASMWDTVKQGAGNAVYGLAKGLADPIYGLSQLALHGANTVSGGRLQGATDNYDRLIKSVEDQYQADTPGSVAAGTGRLVGNLAGPLKGVTVVKSAGMIPRAINAAGTGAAIGAAQPVNTGPSTTTLPDLVAGKTPTPYWNEKGMQVGVGAAAGGALSGLGSLAGGTFNAVRPLVAPKSAAGDILLKGVQGSTDDAGSLSALVNNPTAVAARLNAAGPLVPGSLPTTAQVGGIPSLVMAEKTLKNNPAYRIPFEDRAIANNQARLTALRGVAGTPDALEAAIQARRDLTGPLYDAANAETHAVDPELDAILNRPSAQAALARGRKLAAERGETAGPTGGTPAQPSPVLDANGQPFPGTPATPPSIDGKTLQYVKMGIDDLQKEGKVNGMGAHEADALGATRNDLDTWLGSNSPTFKQANTGFAQASVPINTMQAGQSILDALSTGTQNAAGDVSPMLSQFRAQYAKALKNSPYGIDPQAQQTLDAIQADLQRETVSNSIRSAGSDTAFNLQAPNWLSSKLFGEGLDGKSVLGRGLGALGGFMTGGPMGAAGGVVAAQKLGSIAGNRVNNQLSQAMLDPQYFAKLLAAAAQRDGAQSGLLGNVPVTAGAVGGDTGLGLLSGN